MTNALEFPIEAFGNDNQVYVIMKAVIAEHTMFAPIALFTYNRLLHTRQTIESLQRNALAGNSELFIFSDSPRSGADRDKVQSVREYLRTIGGFNKVQIMEREKNFGLAQSIISGVTEIVNKYGRIIVLEDDMVTSPFFLRFMNDALEFYKDAERVISIHGYIYPLQTALPETFFLRGADCWGWSTWKRGWDLFEANGKKLLYELQSRHLENEFDLHGSYPYTQMLKRQATSKIDSWAVRWHASAFLHDKLTLYPGTSLVSNIGLDASGTHCTPTDKFDITLSPRPVAVGPIPIEQCEDVRLALERYFRSIRPSLAGIAFRRLAFLLARWKGRPCES
jgi:hypothetical protein